MADDTGLFQIERIHERQHVGCMLVGAERSSGLVAVAEAAQVRREQGVALGEPRHDRLPGSASIPASHAAAGWRAPCRCARHGRPRRWPEPSNAPSGLLPFLVTDPSMTEKRSRALHAFSNHRKMIRLFVMAWTGMTNPRSGARFDWLHYSSETPRNSPRPRHCLASHPRLELGPTEGQILPRYGARRGGRVVECTALEMRHRCKPIGGSNPSLSAISMPQLSPVSDCSNLPQGDRRIPRFCVNSSRKL